MKIHLLFISIFCLQLSWGQISIDSTYYKDKYQQQEVDYGPYLLRKIQLNDSVIETEFQITKKKQLIWTKSYLGEQPYGIWKNFKKNGTLDYSRSYNFVIQYGVYIPEEVYNKPMSGVVHSVTEENNEIIFNHIKKSFFIPESIMEIGEEYRIWTQFTIDTEGNVGNVRILEKNNPECDAECFRIYSSIPKLKPEIVDGKAVMIYCKMPLTFRTL